MKKVYLQIAWHHHQPVGNLTSILEDCYQRCYWPILQAIERYPVLKFNLSYSGPLLEFFKNKHPEFLQLLSKLVVQERVELLSGGFYEPILAELSEEDRVGQLDTMNQWLRDELDVRPKGAWLSEFVWDQSLASTLRSAGLEYTLLEGERFLQAGVPEAQLQGYQVTEHLGNVLNLFPSDVNLFRLMPYQPVDEVVSYLRRVANRGGSPTLTFADNAERWGLWPASYEKVQESGYLDELFRKLSEASEWAPMCLMSHTLEREQSRGRCYIPPGPSTEMGAWSLPEESRRQFISGRQNLQQRHDAGRFVPFYRAGSWGGFRRRYSESNLMEKKGLWLSRWMREENREDSEVRQLLWQAQCNTAYWHGSSGGIYLPHLRDAIWARLLQAQEELGASLESYKQEVVDIDADGRDEIVVLNREFSYVISPAKGGECLEWSLLPPKINLGNTLTRRLESSLEAVDEKAVSPSVSSPLDTHDRHLFIDRFLERHITAEELSDNRFKELGDFAGSEYRLVQTVNRADSLEVTLERHGKVIIGNSLQSLYLQKSYLWSTDLKKLVLRWVVKNTSPIPYASVLATELNLALPMGEDLENRYSLESRTYGFDKAWYEGTVSSLAMQSKVGGLHIDFKMTAISSVWSYPIYSSQSLSGHVPLVRQGSCLVLGWFFDLAVGQEQTFELECVVQEMQEKRIECP
ncbi:MAG: alpha-amylase/4-alpha-glucanotransferase domain-containing protein [Blastochloris sp.]|nr:alpha-amylase/4-alpha-glucanotransferase domain-containing protein [Blastochloris sp.]